MNSYTVYCMRRKIPLALSRRKCRYFSSLRVSLSHPSLQKKHVFQHFISIWWLEDNAPLHVLRFPTPFCLFSKSASFASQKWQFCKTALRSCLTEGGGELWFEAGTFLGKEDDSLHRKKEKTNIFRPRWQNRLKGLAMWSAKGRTHDRKHRSLILPHCG